jgi:3-amino-5-hydroxybenzoate synthase
MDELAIDGGEMAATAVEFPDWPQPTSTGRANLEDAYQSGAWCRLEDEASWAERFEASFAEYHDAEHALAVANGTVALELALRAVDVQPGDEVIVPAYTFIATASAVACRGAIPRFADVDPDTYTIDADSVEEKITPKTAGVIGVHYAGHPIDFDTLLPVIEEHDLFLIEDAAHAHGTEWNGNKVGTIGDVGTFSFQNTKTVPAGEGGVVLTDDTIQYEELELVHNIGRKPGKPGYRHYNQASNYRLSEFQAAVLCGQLEEQKSRNQRRQQCAEQLRRELTSIDGIDLEPSDDRITNRGYYQFALLYHRDHFGGLARPEFVETLNAEGIPAGEGYTRPLYRQPAFKQGEFANLLPPDVEVPDYRNLHLPHTEYVAEKLISIPQNVLLGDPSDMECIARAIRKIKQATN